MKRLWLAAAMLVAVSGPACALDFGDGIAAEDTLAGPYSATDYIPLVRGGSGNAVKKIIASTLATLSDVQTIINKTINCANNTCTVRIGNDVSGLGTDVATALSVSIGNGGGVVLFGGAGGTPASLNLANATFPNINSTPGTYGTATKVPQIAVNASGRITGVVEIPITGGGGGSGDPAAFFACSTTAGAANTYTCATPSPNTFALTGGFTVVTRINAANTAASTLSVGGLAAKDIRLQSESGLTALSGGELLVGEQFYSFTYNSSADVFVLTNPLAAGATIGATTAPITKAQWANNHLFVITGSGKTITIPAGLDGKGGALFMAIGNPFTLQPSGSDTVNGGSGGAAVTVPAGALVQLVGDGASPAAYDAASLGGGGGASTITDGTHTQTAVTTLSLGNGLQTTDGSSGTAPIKLTNTQNVQSGATYTIQTTDGAATVIMTNAAATTVTNLTAASAGIGFSFPLICDAGCTVNRASSDTFNGTDTTVTIPAHGLGFFQAPPSGGGVNWRVTVSSGSDPLRPVNHPGGWVAGIDPNKIIIASITQASRVTAITGIPAVGTGAAATVSVYKAPSGTACSAGTILHSGSFNANGTANTKQSLTLVGGATDDLAVDDYLCFVTSGSTNWTTGSGIGTITVAVKPL